MLLVITAAFSLVLNWITWHPAAGPGARLRVPAASRMSLVALALGVDAAFVLDPPHRPRIVLIVSLVP